MITKQCKKCKFYVGWCNRLIVRGGYGRSDKLASDTVTKNHPICKYMEEGHPLPQGEKPNFENS